MALVILALLALLALVLGLIACRRVFDSTLPNIWFDPVLEAKVRQVRRLARRRYRPAVLVVGHSIVFDWFDPGVFASSDPRGRKAYNAGVNLIVWDVTEDWLTFLLSVWSPEVIVLGLSTMDLNANGAEHRTIVAKHKATLAGQFHGLVPSWRRTLTAARVLNPSRRRFWQLLKRGRASLPDAAKLIGPLGADLHKIGRRYAMNDGFARAFRERWLVDFAIGDDPVSSTRRLLRTAAASGARVVLVEAPYTDDMLRLFPDGDGEESQRLAHQTLRRLCDDEGVRLLEPPRGMLPDELFADPIHLNDRGTRVMTQWLAQQQL
jgi:hypothetical protein